jgi:hypothetical protein
MAKMALFIFVKLITINALSAQSFIALNAVPSFGFSRTKITGKPFIGYKPNKVNLELASSFYFGYKFKYFSINLGVNYYLNINRTKYYSNDSDNKILLNRNSLEITYFEPIIAIETPLIKRNTYRIEVGIGFAYQMQATIPFSLESTIYLPEKANLGDIMIDQFTINGKNLNRTERIKYLPRITFDYNINKNLVSSTGVLVRVSSDEANVLRNIDLNNSNYVFQYNLNSSSVGLILGIMYILN